MSYRLYANKRNPLGLWYNEGLLDESGINETAELLGNVPDHAPSLVADAINSFVIDKDSRVRFPSPVFKQGRESQPFALEAWVYPVIRSSHEDAPVTNYQPDPFFTNGAAGYTFAGATTELDATHFKFGTQSLKVTTDVEGTSFSHNGNLIIDTTGMDRIYARAWVYAAPGNTDTGVSNDGPLVRIGGTGVVAANSPRVETVGEWVAIDFDVPTDGDGGTAVMYLYNGREAGDVVWWDGLYLSDQPLPEVGVFDGNTSGAEWSGTEHDSSSILLTNSSSQQILSNDGNYDGLTIENKLVSFSTKYQTFGECKVSYDLEVYKAAHIVGVHTNEENRLYVNGELVGQTEITDDQRLDSYVATDDYLYCGDTDSSQAIAINGIAVYRNFSPTGVLQNFDAGRRVTPQDDIYPTYSGLAIDIDYESSEVIYDEIWVNEDDFNEGLVESIALGEEAIYPAVDEDNISLAGSWTLGIDIDNFEETSIYGIMAEWSGRGVSVDASMDGETWTPIESGKLISLIPDGFDPTGNDLEIRFSFAGGIQDDDSYVESIRVIGYLNNEIDTFEERDVTITHPAVPRGDFEPIEYRDDNGIYLSGGSFTIGPDLTLVNEVANPSLEDDSTGWGGTGSTARIEATTTPAPAGDFYFRSTHPGSLTIGQPVLDGSSQRVDIDPNKAYSMGIWLRRPNSDGVNKVRYLCPQYNSSGSFLTSLTIISEINLVAGQDEWVFVSAENVTGWHEDAVKAWPFAIYPAPGWSYTEGGHIDGDAAVFVEGDTLEEYFENAPEDPMHVLEAWIKPVSGSPSISVTGTQYVNGEASGTLPVGLWSLVHIHSTEEITDVTISGDCIVGRVVLYDENFITDDGPATVYKWYTGRNPLRIVDASTITLTEPNPPTNIYSHDWAIDGAG